MKSAKDRNFPWGSLRSRYRFLPRSAWAELNRLKREEGFSDLLGDPGPGSLALLRCVRHPSNGTIDCIVVDDCGQVLRFSDTITPLTPLPSKVA